MYTQTELALAWGGRLGHLETRGPLRYLRALEIQGDLGYARAFDSEGSSGFFLDPVVDYSMPYLDYTEGGLPFLLRYLCPFVELNLYRSIGRGAAGRSKLFLMPGVAFVAQTFQVSAGAQIALDHETARNTQFTMLGSILIFLDAIDRRFAWLPF